MLNRPNNVLTNRLGLGSVWNSPSAEFKNNSGYLSLNLFKLRRYFYLIFRSGYLYTHHPFFHKFFIKKDEMISLPAYITEFNYSRFYRNYTVKLHYDFRFKSTFMARNLYLFINISSVYFYSIGSYLLALVNIYKPLNITSSRDDSRIRKGGLSGNKDFINYSLYNLWFKLWIYNPSKRFKEYNYF